MEEEKGETWAKFLCSYLLLILIFILFMLVMTPRQLKPLKKDPNSAESMKADNCSRSLLQICASMRDAVHCNVTPYCIHCNWATDFNPNDAFEEKCSRCLNSIHTLYEEIEYKTKDNSSVQKIYPKILKSICNLHINTETRGSCIRNMEHYLANQQEFWSINPTELTKLEICSILGMCYSEFTLFLPQDSSNLKPELASDSYSLSQYPIQKIPGVKLISPKSTEQKEARKFVPVFIPSCSKHVCMFKDISEYKPFWKWTLILGTIIVGILCIGAFCMKKLLKEEEILEIVEEVEEKFEIEEDEQEPMTSRNNFDHFNAIMGGELQPSARNNVDNAAPLQNNPFDVQNVVDHMQNVVEDLQNGIQQADLEN